jgi:threonine/homoserine/homoserine lactone efflux protein
MDVLSFVATVVLVTASGALAPGPLFFVTLSHGARSGAKSGIIFSAAHTLVEFALVLLLAGGLLAVANQPAVRFVVGMHACRRDSSHRFRRYAGPRFPETKVRRG